MAELPTLSPAPGYAVPAQPLPLFTYELDKPLSQSEGTGGASVGKEAHYADVSAFASGVARAGWTTVSRGRRTRRVHRGSEDGPQRR